MKSGVADKACKDGVFRKWFLYEDLDWRPTKMEFQNGVLSEDGIWTAVRFSHAR